MGKDSYSWLPIDVGFDVRVAGIAIVIPDDCDEVRYDDKGCIRVVRGPKRRIAEALRAAGYEVAEPEGGAS